VQGFDEASGSSRLITDGGAVIARVGGAAALAGLGIDANGVDQADVPLAFNRVARAVSSALPFPEKTASPSTPRPAATGGGNGGVNAACASMPRRIQSDGEQRGGNNGGASGRTSDKAELPVAKHNGRRH